MLNYYLSETDRINAMLAEKAPISLEELAAEYIDRFMTSRKRADMLTGERYYNGKHDILHRVRTAIGEGGEVTEIDNLPNNRVVDNIYKNVVDQKVNYLLGKPVTLRCDEGGERAEGIFDRSFARLLKYIGEDALNCGIGWLYAGFDGRGKPHFKRIRPYDLIPVWADSEHTRLDFAVRLYQTVQMQGRREKRVMNAEIYTHRGVRRYLVKNGSLEPVSGLLPYGTKCGIPLVAFKYNASEQPLIKNVKALQDGLNSLISDFQNCMEEDVRNTILVIKNYDGEDLGQFRKNLSAYGAVKVKTVDGSQGGVETLNIEVNAENYKTIIAMFHKAVIENGRGYDVKELKLGAAPNQMNIMSMYNDIDIDASAMETEFSCSLEQVLRLAGIAPQKVHFIFNRSMIMNESELIENIAKTKQLGLLGDELLTAKHPWTV